MQKVLLRHMICLHYLYRVDKISSFQLKQSDVGSLDDK